MCRRALLPFDLLESFDRREEVSGFGFLATGKRER
jgi:hypothetical protein